MLELQTSINIQKLIDFLGAVSGLEAGFISQNMSIVAGTGERMLKPGEQCNSNSCISDIFKMREPLVIHSRAQKCRACYDKYCPYQAAVFSPVLVNKEIEGILCLLSHNHEQQLIIQREGANLLNGLYEIGNLIANRINLNNVVDTSLNAVFETSEAGMIWLEDSGNIKKINDPAKKLIDLFLFDQRAKDAQTFLKNFRSTAQKNNFAYSIRSVNNDTVVSGYIITIQPNTDLVESNNPLSPPVQTLGAYEDPFADIVGKTHIFTRAIDNARKIAHSDSTVILLGETGTGKELFARGIHLHSSRRKGPFVVVNCASVPESLLESEWFGYSEGAFTGARRGGKPGKFEQADRGTIFLDEIGDLPLFLQAKLLRFLEDGLVERIGSVTPKKINVRLIAATNRNLAEMVEDGSFRPDLYYRLNVVPIHLPPLRERKEDIPELIQHFSRHYSIILKKKPKRMTPEVMAFFNEYGWPGNVREVRNVIEYLHSLAPGEQVGIEDLPPLLFIHHKKLKEEARGETGAHNNNLNLVEKTAIVNALNRYGISTSGKKSTAKELGISLSTLYRKMKKYNL